jgi:hypothetical protein
MLVPLHSGFDRLPIARQQHRQSGWIDQNGDAASHPWLA